MHKNEFSYDDINMNEEVKPINIEKFQWEEDVNFRTFAPDFENTKSQIIKSQPKININPLGRNSKQNIKYESYLINFTCFILNIKNTNLIWM